MEISQSWYLFTSYLEHYCNAHNVLKYSLSVDVSFALPRLIHCTAFLSLLVFNSTAHYPTCTSLVLNDNRPLNSRTQQQFIQLKAFWRLRTGFRPSLIGRAGWAVPEEPRNWGVVEEVEKCPEREKHEYASSTCLIRSPHGNPVNFEIYAF
jgi:hypothetical protein